MAGHTLLTRIQHPELAIARRQVSDSEIRDSILANLRGICSTRNGSTPACPEYGLVDVSELIHNFPDAIAMMARSIRNSSTRYEPRLTNVVLKHVPNESGDLTLRYEIIGQVVGGDGRNKVRFETHIDPSRKIGVD